MYCPLHFQLEIFTGARGASRNTHRSSREFLAFPLKFQVHLEVLINLSKILPVFTEIHPVILYGLVLTDGRTEKY
jgi:hypothetical protein